MQILNIRDDHRDEDLAAARTVVEQEIAAPAMNLLVMFGGDDVEPLSKRVGIRADVFSWREAIWLQGSAENATEVLGADRFAAWFPDEPTPCAVVLNFDDQPVRRLASDASLLTVERAFLAAQRGGQL